MEKKRFGWSKVSSKSNPRTKVNFIFSDESSRRVDDDGSTEKFSVRKCSRSVDLRAPPTFSGSPRKWIFERSNRKCLFIAGACTRPPDTGIPR